ncbi:MBL fold metallo-hydrolase [candidate division WOR-3 bacterium]|nr:MBL fold metallo-hydrolase [candidate division WOR-3 bacterium]
MKIIFLGHASFLIVSEKGTRIITDPYKPGCFEGGIKYAPITEPADVVTISHEHDDHNCTAVEGNPVFVRGEDRKEIKDIVISGTPTFHDTERGTARGSNTIFKMTIDGMNVVHLGDLGHQLSEEEVSSIGEVDILFMPVGGHFTIDARAGEDTVSKLMPRIVIPMHFKTEKCEFPIAPVDDYIRDKDVQEFSGEVEITKATLPDRTATYVLAPTK